MTANRVAITRALDEHFITWGRHRAPTLGGQWRCICGIRFAWSTDAIDHLVDAVLAALDDDDDDPPAGEYERRARS